MRRTLFLALPCWAALAFPGLALATTVAPAATSVELSPVSTLLQTVLAMAVVLGVILGLAWLARRVNPMALTGNPASLRVVSGVMVGQRERVVVVEVQGKWLVLGVAAQSVNLLCTLDKPEDVPADVPVARGAFADKLRTLLESRGISLPKKPS
ncbi:flagellar biosynthetic protein FliO [Rivihabitans pingtungensis]|uniref:flagellar biosynthetic protein FliO n=1 Tax=Rivihabitans pingtungensis TaxID=1054498 RepID=UPI002CAE40B8|nr:flagellar biosynthetic protein FliO [Rivihabitans pingtungensis]HNX69811.1 flagellar biosynthetic protein FliO [Rivihabitans pingtungensis]